MLTRLDSKKCEILHLLVVLMWSCLILWKSYLKNKTEIIFMCHSETRLYVFLVAGSCVGASIFKASTPYLIIYTLEANWRYSFLWRKRKGVGGGIRGMHALVSFL